MDLDQLKQKWQAETAHSSARDVDLSYNLREPARSSLSALKRSFRKQIVLMALLFTLIYYQFRHKELFINTFFWWYFAFCFGLALFFYVNYRLVQRLEKSDQPLTSHLRAEVNIIEKRMRWQRVFTRLVAIVLMVLAEILPFYSNESMVVKWHAVEPALRVAAYAAFLVFQYYVGRRLAKRRYGQHLERLKQILNDTL